MSESDWLDGPGFVEWIEAECRNLEVSAELGLATARRWREWRRGAKVHYDKADEVLTRLGRNLHHLPDELWVDAPDRGRAFTRVCTSAQRERAVQMLERDVPRHTVAAIFGVTARTVGEWRAQARKQAA